MLVNIFSNIFIVLAHLWYVGVDVKNYAFMPKYRLYRFSDQRFNLSKGIPTGLPNKLSTYFDERNYCTYMNSLTEEAFSI